MKILPTIHIQKGRAAPSLDGGADPEDPWKLLEALLAAGWQRLALMDADSDDYNGHQRDLIAALIRRFSQVHHGRCCILVGGGVRSSDEAQFYMDRGATWLALGSTVLRHSMMAEQLLARHRDHLLPIIPSRDGLVPDRAWNLPFRLTALEMARRVRDMGFRRLLLLDRSEAPGFPPDFSTARCVAEGTHLPLFMGGPFHTHPDLEQARHLNPHLQGLLVEATRLLRDPALADPSLHPCP